MKSRYQFSHYKTDKSCFIEGQNQTTLLCPKAVIVSHRLGRLAFPEDLSVTSYFAIEYPLLWKTFPNDLNVFANEHNLTMMYDHQLYSVGQTVKEVQDTLNKEGEIISKWYESNLLKGNYEKYQIMSMGPKEKIKDSSMSNTPKPSRFL